MPSECFVCWEAVLLLPALASAPELAKLPLLVLALALALALALPLPLLLRGVLGRAVAVLVLQQ